MPVASRSLRQTRPRPGGAATGSLVAAADSWHSRKACTGRVPACRSGVFDLLDDSVEQIGADYAAEIVVHALGLLAVGAAINLVDSEALLFQERRNLGGLVHHRLAP